MSRPYAPLFRAITTSERLADLPDDTARLFFSWLLTVVDDWGRVTARPRTLNATVWPMLGKTPEDVERAVEACRSVGLLSVFESDDGPFVQIMDHEDKSGSLGKKDHRKASHWPETALLAPLGPDWPAMARPGPGRPAPSLKNRTEENKNRLPASPPPGGREPAPKPRKESTGPAAEVTRAFEAAFFKARGVKYAFEGGKDGQAVKSLLERAGGNPAAVIERIPRLFADEFYGPKATLTMFLTGWNRLAPIKPTVQAPPPIDPAKAAEWERKYGKGQRNDTQPVNGTEHPHA